MNDNLSNTTNKINDQESERVSIFFSCRSLKKIEGHSQSKLLIQLKQLVSKDKWTTIGHTESVQNNPNPDFSANFVLDFVFETRQKFKVELIEIEYQEKGKTVHFDQPTATAKQGEHSENIKTRLEVNGLVLAQAFFELGDLAGSIDNSKILFLMKPDNSNLGHCVVRLEKLNDKDKYEFSFEMLVKNIPKINMFSSKNTYIKIYKQRIPDALLRKIIEQDENISQIKTFEWMCVHKTQNLPGQNVYFPTICLNGSKLCYNNRQIPLKFEIWKYKKDGKDYLLGKVILSLNEITMSKSREFKFDMVKKNIASASLKFENFKNEVIYDFVDFIHGGINMNFVVGIDFTLSNKDASDVNSLHYFNGKVPNLYQKAILSVGEILEKYNNSNEIAAYGFGAKIDPNSPVSHFFPINLNYSNPFFGHFREMFDAYCKIVNKIQFSGPTHFAPLLERVLEFTQRKFETDSHNYTVFLLMTDGEVTDLQETIDSIIKGCDLPLSIIIVGIGNESFTKMDQLDANDIPLCASNGQVMKRDIVRFVAFNTFSNNPILLREEVLRELPDQVVQFYKMMNIQPGKKKEIDQQKFLHLNTINDLSNKNNTSFPSVEQWIENEFGNSLRK